MRTRSFVRPFQVALTVLAVGAASSALAATEQQKQAAINSGLAWLATAQSTNGTESWWSYGNDGTVAATASAALAFIEEGYIPWQPDTAGLGYNALAERAVTFLFNRATVDGRFGVETAGYTRYAEDYNNDGNYDNDGGNDQAIFFEPGPPSRRMYTTGLVVPVVYALGEALGTNAIIGVGSAAINGKTYAQAMQDLVDWFAFGQVEPDRGAFRGGWRYDANWSDSDNSTAQWGALPFLYATDWSLGVSQFVRDELDLWTTYIQNANGGSGYDNPNNIVCISKTGGMLLEFAVVGLAADNPRVQAALGYIDTHWNEGVYGEWYGNFNNAYAMWALYKGLQTYGLTSTVLSGGEHILIGTGISNAVSGYTIGQDWDQDPPLVSAPGDWYSHYCEYLVNIQNGDGSWSGSSYWTGALASGWYINIINATGRPEPYIPPCVMAKVEEPVYANRHLTVPISLSNVDPVNQDPITGIDVVFNFDAQVLTPVGIGLNGTLLDGLGWGHIANSPVPGQYRVGLFGVPAIPGDGILLNLEFDIPDSAPCDGSTPLALEMLLNEGQPCVAISPDSWTTWIRPMAQVSGTVRYWACPSLGNEHPPIEGVQVNMQNSSQNESTVTNEQGFFQLPACSDSCLTLTPSKACGGTEGISTLDAALVLRYFVGMETLTECPVGPMEQYDGSLCPSEAFYPQLLAADVSGNGGIHSFDASIILRYLLGEDVSNYRVGCWSFYCNQREFCADEDLTPDQDFVGLLYGDVTGSYGLLFPERDARDSNAAIALGRVEAEVGGTAAVPLSLLDADGYFGIQFHVAHDPNYLSVADVQLVDMGAGSLLEWVVEADGIRVAVANPAGFIGNGDLCQIIYNVDGFPESGVCPLDVTNARIDERPGDAVTAGGAVVSMLTSVDPSTTLPRTCALLAPVPNPFNPSTTVGFLLPASCEVRLDVFDIRGGLVRTLIDDVLPAGEHRMVWKGVNNLGQRVPSGMYFLRMQTPGFSDVRKMTMMQ